jgi:methionine biosynthesis protein MetW
MTGMITKLERVLAYLFREYGFKDAPFDYDGYWEQLSRSEEHPASQYKLRLIESLIDEGSSVLDMGCGDGTLLYHLTRAKNIRGHGLELSATGVELTKKKGLSVDQVDLSDKTLEINGHYDYIISSEVMEHIPEPEAMIKRLKGKFNKYLIISVPNTGFLGERLRLLFGKAPKQWVYHPSEHLRFWTVSDFLFWIEQLGLKVDRYYGLLDEYYDIKIPLWKWSPRLFSRYILYLIKEAA